MSDEKMIKEKLELLKNYMYQELKHLKASIAEDNMHINSETGQMANLAEKCKKDLSINKKSGMRKMKRTFSAVSCYRRYRRNYFTPALDT